MPVLTSEERIGTEIGGRYKIKRLIGEGAFGAVFSAEHLLTGREVALKLLHAHLVQAEQMAQRFLREAQAMAKLRHPAIVEVLDAGKEADGTLFLALELLEGETLEDLLVRSGRLGIRESVQTIERVLSALTVAHSAGIVHRDIKPANIFLAKDAEGETRPKLLDFGIAAVTSSSQSREGKLTNAGMILGTPEYMAPEQGRSSKVGPQADLWSIGIVLYELFSGVVPWSSDSATAVLLSVASDPLPNILEFAPDLPRELVAVIERALQKQPDQRFSSAAEMRTALLQAAEASGHYSRPTSGPGAGSGVFNVAALLGQAPADAMSTSASTSTSGGIPAAIPSKRRAQDELDLGGGDPTSLALQLDPKSASTTGRFKQRPPLPDVLPEPSESDALGGTLLQSMDGLAGDLPMPDLSSMPEAPKPGSTSSPRIDARADTSGAHRPVTGSHARITPAALPAASPTRPAQIEGAGLLPSPAAISFDTGAGRSSSTPAVERAGAHAPEKKFPVAAIAVPLGIVALAVVGFVALRNPTGQHGGGLSNPTAEPTGDTTPDPIREAPPSRSFAERIAISLPFGVSGSSAQAFGRHVSVGPLANGSRVISTCAAGTLYAYQGGEPLGTAALGISCDGHDLIGIPDVDNDQQTDFAAVTRAHDGIALIVGRGTLRVARTIPLPRVDGLAGYFDLRGAPVVIAYVESAQPNGSSEVNAVSLTDGRVLWRIAGSAPFVRVGVPLELGLSVGPDANGDSISDVAVGLSVPANLAADQAPSRPRCVHLFSGADGRAIWREPFCQLRGGKQSVSLGPDADGDGRADIAVGTDLSRGADGRVVLLSGADAHVLRRISAPSGPSGQGFGWPVVLGSDLSGDQRADLLVGSVGSGGTFVNLFSGADGARLAERPVRGSPGYPNLRVGITDGLVRGNGPLVYVGSPEAGIHVLGLE